MITINKILKLLSFCIIVVLVGCGGAQDQEAKYLARAQAHFDENNLRPVGLRIHLGNEILYYDDGQKIDLSAKDSPDFKKIDISQDSFELKPGQFILGHTMERIKTRESLEADLNLLFIKFFYCLSQASIKILSIHKINTFVALKQSRCSISTGIVLLTFNL